MYKISEIAANIYEKDPAAKSMLEVYLCYPGLHALIFHRLANTVWHSGFRTIARMISQLARFLTGIEIHPAAKIGNRLFIDHGMGVVIGETTVIGDDVTLYQGVTLGADSKARMGATTRSTKRHPTIGNNVVIGSKAEVQGDILIGDNCLVASGAIVLESIPANCVVVGVPGRILYDNGIRQNLESSEIKALKERVSQIEKIVNLQELNKN